MQKKWVSDLPLPVKVYRFMLQHPHIAFTEIDIIAAFDCSFARAQWAIKRLLAEQLVVPSRRVGSATYYIVADAADTQKRSMGFAHRIH